MRYNANNIKYNQINVKYNGFIGIILNDYSNLTTTNIDLLKFVSTGIVSLSFPSSEIFATTSINNSSNIDGAESKVKVNGINGIVSVNVIDSSQNSSEIKTINISTMGNKS